MSIVRLSRRLLAVLLPCFLATAWQASAQAVPAASGPGFYLSAGVAGSAFQVDYGQRILGGVNIFADLHVRSRYSLEGEVRLLRFHTDEQVTQTHLLVGPRVEVFHRGPVHVYGKFLIGGGFMRFPFDYATGSYFALAPGAGIEIPLGSRVTWRPVDVEYQSWPQFTYGNLHPYGISSGVRFQLTRPNLFKRDPYIF
ncbi:MAG: outer membrane beta-barrel protein [Acidobacteriaceae bacterium]|nr:outer membrane beta-barrel protein [Acidobacteriaceae bacterium]